MFRPLTSTARRADRRGAILVVVLGLLTLFAVLGISFVYYANSEATTSRIARDIEFQDALTLPDATAAVNHFLGSLIYPLNDNDPTTYLNALRGHELLRAMYGGRPGSNVPYNGTGTFHEDAKAYGVPGLAAVPGALDRAHLINGTAMRVGLTATNQPYPVLLDPEWTGVRPITPGGSLDTTPPSAAAGRAYVPKNGAYTYPDLKDFYLGALSPATGEVVTPSFHRAWLFNARNQNPRMRLAPWNPSDPDLSDPNATNTAANTDWVTPEGRLKILRPRPVDQLTPREIATTLGNPSTDDQPIPPGLAGLSVAQQVALYNLIQQRIAAGTIIGYPEQNADGSFTGDHVNRNGAVGVQRADSIVIDANMQPVRLTNGRWVKPVVSALVTDLNGRLDVSSHGNTQNGGNHNSYHGLGSWEVNPRYVLADPVADPTGATHARNLVNNRTALQVSRGGVTTRQFEGSGVRLSDYAKVIWRLDQNGQAPTIPTAPTTSFQTSAQFATPPYEDNSAAAGPHPSLFNPAEWDAATTPNRTYATSKLRRMNMQFAPSLRDYAENGFPVNSGLNQSPPRNANYRTATSHIALNLVTTRSTTLDRPGLMPNFATLGTNSALQYITPPAPQLPYLGYPTAPPFIGAYPVPPPAPGTTTADFDLANLTWGNVRAQVGPMDLNRRLADYRDASLPAGPLSPANVSADSALVAQMDRQNFARDVFIRLAVASGVQLTFDGSNNPLVAAAAGTAEFNAARAVAQLAANITDSIDDDDATTPFIWNLTGGGGVGVPVYNDPNVYRVALNQNAAPAAVGNSVVFGVERPRLVLNEAYSEITNDAGEAVTGATPATAPTLPAHVRFWVELLNPTNTASTGTPASPIGTGAAQLRYEAADGATVPYSPYRLVVAKAVRGASDGVLFLSDPSNVQGGLTAAHAPEIEFDFSTAGANRVVAPNNGSYATAGNPANGMVFVVPTATAGPAGVEFATPAGWTNAIVAPAATGPTPNQNAMNYQLATVPDAGTGVTELGGSELKRHVILLRRLMNPYARPNDPAIAAPPFDPNLPINAYITVDYMDYVPAMDAVNRAGPTTPGNQRSARPGTANGYDPFASRFSVGKVQPYTGQALGVAAMNALPTYTFPNSFVLAQNPTTPPPATEPRHTFGRHNGQQTTPPGGGYGTTNTLPAVATETIMAPYEWYVHFDRPLVNQLELLHVRGGKPHEVTQHYIVNGASGLDKTAGQAAWLPSPTFPAQNGLYRALDLLRVQSRTYGTPLGGKVHGRINLNTIQHPAVLQALFDSQAGTTFTANDVYDPSGTLPSDVWRRLIGTVSASPPSARTANVQTRTLADQTTTVPVPVPGPSVHDVLLGSYPNLPAQLDRPFLPLSAPQFTAGVFAAQAGSGLNDTLMRANPLDPVNPTRPLIYPPAAVSPAVDPHPYFLAEGARKIFNNATTVSDTFEVTFTIAFHEIRTDNGNLLTDAFGRHLLGKEAYKDIPGDMRQQFHAVIDRANAGYNPNSPNDVVGQPFFTTVEAAAPAGSTSVTFAATGFDAAANHLIVYADGQEVRIGAPTAQYPNAVQQLVLGVGADQELVTISTMVAPTYTAPGLGTVTLSTATTKPHAIGVCVSNAVMGNYGAPLDLATLNRVFDYRDPRLAGVMPHLTRVR
jgi:hypothetical protein